MALVTLCLLILLPYFAYVSAFLHPLNVVSRIRLHALRVIQRGSRHYRRKQRAEAIVCIEELEDVALNAIEHKDRSISMASVDALAQLVQDYAALRPRFCEAWSRIDGNLARDPDFVAMDPIALEEVSEKRLWFEMKVLRQYHTIFVTALNRVRDVCYLIALDTRRIARGTGRDHPELCELAIRFFNSYLRAAINARDLRTGYYVTHHYRQLAEDLLAIGDGERVVRIAQHLRFYGQLAFDQGMPFLLEVVAYDLSLVTEKALEHDAPEADALLAVLMRVDKEGESPDQEHSLRGVRRAQVRLATFLLARGDVGRAKLVYADMECERPELLDAVRTELLTEERPMYWEVTDRGVNFAYLPPERRSRVGEFFAWFGLRPAPHA
jgi:hypothetical protein